MTSRKHDCRLTSAEADTIGRLLLPEYPFCPHDLLSSTSGRSSVSSAPGLEETEDKMAAMGGIAFKCSDCSVCFVTLGGFQAHDCVSKAANQRETSLAAPDVSMQSCSSPAAEPSHAVPSYTSSQSGCTWDSQRTKQLLELYRDKKEMFASPLVKKKRIWEEISQKLNTLCLTSFTTAQVEGRWKTVLTSYRKHKDDQNQTGAARKAFENTDIMDDILGDSHSTVPKFLFSSNTNPSSSLTSTCSNHSSSFTSTSSNAEDRLEEKSEGSDGDTEPEFKRKKKCRKSVSGATQMISFLQSYTDRAEKREAEAMRKADERHNENMNVLRSLIGVMKDLKK